MNKVLTFNKIYDIISIDKESYILLCLYDMHK